MRRITAGRCLVAGLAALFLASVLTTPAAAADRRAGSVTVMKAEDPGTTRQSGVAGDRFILKLPVRAACPGDSLNDDYRIQTFIVPAADDPGSLVYESVKPAGDGRWALHNQWGSRWVQKMTSPNSSAGAPGLIDEFPLVTLGYFSPGQLPTGTYRVGVACTFENATTRYWDARMDITAGEAGGPLSWTVLDQAPYSAPNGPGWLGPFVVALAGFLLLFAGAYWFLSRRSRDRELPPSRAADAAPQKEILS